MTVLIAGCSSRWTATTSKRLHRRWSSTLLHREGAELKNILSSLLSSLNSQFLSQNLWNLHADCWCAGQTTGGEEGPAEESRGEKKYSKFICSIVMELAVIDKDWWYLFTFAGEDFRFGTELGTDSSLLQIENPGPDSALWPRTRNLATLSKKYSSTNLQKHNSKFKSLLCVVSPTIVNAAAVVFKDMFGSQD